MVRRLLKHALIFNGTHTHNRKGTETVHSRAHNACTQHCQHVYGTWASLKLKLTHTHAHAGTHAQTGKLANKRSNNAGTAKATKHQTTEQQQLKNHANSKGKYWEIHAFMNIMSSDIKALSLAYYYFVPFFVCTFSPLALPFFFCISLTPWVNMSKPN